MLKTLGALIATLAASACGSSEDTAASGPVGPFKIGAIADCQYADQEPDRERLYRSCPAKLEEAVGVLNEFDLDFVMHLGDFVDSGWDNFAPLNKIMDDLRHPVRHVAGNHDYWVSDEQKAGVHTMLGMPDRYYSFQHGNWVFALVDGNDLSYHAWPKDSERHRESVRYHKRGHGDKATWNGAVGETQLALSLIHI